MKNKKIRMMTFASLLAAFTCIATILIRIPTPTKGYVNLGDCIVNVSAWLLGPFYGAFAAAVGSSLADIFSGYVVYAAATFIIKGAAAFASYHICRLISRKNNSFAARISGAVIGELVMVTGYFLFESIIYGSVATALLGVAGNAAQGIIGAAGSVIVYEALIKKIPKSI